MYQIEYSRRSIRALRRMPATVAILTRSKIEAVAKDPFGAQGVKKLIGRDGYRLRVGDGKPEYVVLPWADYQALLEAAEDAIDGALLDEFRKKLTSGEDETVPAVVVDALLAGTHPVKVWREYRGLMQDELATQAGISKPYLCQIETGKRQGAIKTLRALAAALGVSVDDLG